MKSALPNKRNDFMRKPDRFHQASSVSVQSAKPGKPRSALTSASG
ncbi:hypothetical protein NK6_530 [Bradyrhizobium diazoefficiens]|uniref:Uncharacterized protein n=1 Tax=Bradyrhizobium diazoefficiens TaxID=1355477 RepID=A0A0E3VSD4_9BRAD|nr:hypothetical protein NK6_530 [Bradyrhizobium diazoefficiens]